MTLRVKLILLFGVFGILPLLAVGVFGYVRTMHTVEAHLESQAGIVARRVVGELEDRLATHRSDMALLAENLETARIYQAARGGREVPGDAAAYLAQAWDQVGPWYHAAELRDRHGRAVHRLGERDPVGYPPPGAGAAALRTERAVRDPDTGELLGSVVALPRADRLLPRELSEARFGTAGYNILVDHVAERVLHHPRHDLVGQPVDSLPAPLAAAIRGGASEALRYRQGDTARVAVLSRLVDPGWTLVTTSSLDEFAAPFDRMRLVNLGLVLLVTLGVALTAVFLIRRETHSLAQLTDAAARVGRGDFTPALPAAGPDEVGRLSAAFGTMTARVQEMMTQVEASRQMAAIGEFAAEIAHEIRNPLTSVKLNLQRLQRLEEGGGLSPEAARPLAISMREIQRLERVVRGVLYLGRPRSEERRLHSLHRVLEDALELVRPQLERQGITLSLELEADPDRVLCDAEQLRGAVLNLLLNSLEAMPAGGRLRVSTCAAAEGMLALHVADSGPGVPLEARERLFRPFFTTKTEGTGLGLAIALRAVEEHGGTLAAVEWEGPGTTFRMELPLAAVPQEVGA